MDCYRESISRFTHYGNYGLLKRCNTYVDPRPLSSRASACRIHHGSKLFSTKARCGYCQLHGKRRFTQRKCPDCPLQPALCQVLDRDCHYDWHSDSFGTIRQLWYEHIQRRSTQPSLSSHNLSKVVCVLDGLGAASIVGIAVVTIV